MGFLKSKQGELAIIGLVFSIFGKLASTWSNSVLYDLICLITVAVGDILMVVGVLWWIFRKRDKYNEGGNNHTPAP
ncbi:MAG: hypothetical protein U9Q22_06335 [Candidatus Altiarchaeota archaeon]|nr:hypothetical protein [Candidatus Altiarchaeota archaeon]